MSSQYFEYIKERENADYYEDESGFFTYKFDHGVFQIQDHWINPEFRGKGFGKKMADVMENLAKEKGCTLMHCTACINAINTEQSVSHILSLGYQIYKADLDMIYFKKEI